MGWPIIIIITGLYLNSGGEMKNKKQLQSNKDRGESVVWYIFIEDVLDVLKMWAIY